MSPSTAASALGKLGAERRHRREPIRVKARDMRAALGMNPAPGLWPELVLTQADRVPS